MLEIGLLVITLLVISYVVLTHGKCAPAADKPQTAVAVAPAVESVAVPLERQALAVRKYLTTEQKAKKALVEQFEFYTNKNDNDCAHKALACQTDEQDSGNVSGLDFNDSGDSYKEYAATNGGIDQQVVENQKKFIEERTAMGVPINKTGRTFTPQASLENVNFMPWQGIRPPRDTPYSDPNFKIAEDPTQVADIGDREMFKWRSFTL